MKDLSIILHATDFSPNAQAAFNLACELAQDHRARLLVLHVAPPLPSEWAGIGLQRPPHLRRNWQNADDQLSELRCRDFRPERLLRTGEPAQVIVNVAKQEGADLIVIGQPQSSFWRWLVEERVAQAVVREAHCPVLVAGNPEVPIEQPEQAKFFDRQRQPECKVAG